MPSGLALGARARSAGYRLTALEAIGSTNSEALAAAAAGDPGGHWIATLHQTAGRGRRGRVWESPQGNLAATLLLLPQSEPGVTATLGFVAGVALNEALASVLPEGVVKVGIDGADGMVGEDRARIALKWPNDVIADGAKLAGILLEAHKLADGRHAIAIGFGVNVVAAPTGLPYPATCLGDLGCRLSAATVFEALSDAWVDSFAKWRDGAGIAEVLQRWRARAAGVGAPVAVNRNGDIVRGIFETVDDNGRLIVRTDDGGLVPITAGDVHFGMTASAPV